MNTRLGLFAVAGIWLTMAMMPLSELLPLDTYQLLFVRGAPALVALFFFGLLKEEWRVELPDRNTATGGMVFAVATICLFNAIKEWGTNLSTVLLNMSVLVNFFCAVTRGERITRSNTGCTSIALIGSFFALRGWDAQHLNTQGLLWSIGAMVMNGLFVEIGACAQQKNTTKVFWWSVSLTLVGLLSSGNTGLGLNAETVVLALFFGIATGLFNFFSAAVALTNLRPVWIGTLGLGTTPAILLGSYFITGKVLAADQLVGVALILAAVGYLSVTLGKKD